MNAGVGIGCVLPQIGPAASPALVTDFAQFVESIGWHSVWVTDRLLYPCDPQTPYAGSADGVLPTAYQRVLDPLTCLTLAALATQYITVGTCVLNAPFYNPLVLARQLTTLDLLSAGRLRVGLGLGWSADEFVAVGVPMEERGRRCQEFVHALKTIWTHNVVEVAGRHYSIPASIIEPKPVQPVHPPIYLASFVDAGLARAAMIGDGWIWTGVETSTLTSLMSRLFEHAAMIDRDPATIRVIVRLQVALMPFQAAPNRLLGHGSAEQILDDLYALSASGVHEIILDPTFTPHGATSAGWFSILDQLSGPVSQLLRTNDIFVRQRSVEVNTTLS